MPRLTWPPALINKRKTRQKTRTRVGLCKTQKTQKTQTQKTQKTQTQKTQTQKTQTQTQKTQTQKTQKNQKQWFNAKSRIFVLSRYWLLIASKSG